MLTDSADEWLSVRVPAGSAIGYVAIYNRNDFQWAADMLNPFELWLTASAGTVSAESPTAHRCGADLSAPMLGPVAIWCGGRSDLRFVTLILRAASDRTRLLSVGEVKVFAA